MSWRTDEVIRPVSTLEWLGLIFVTLKLCGVIDWYWVFVSIPFVIVYGTRLFLDFFAFVRQQE